MKYPINIFQDGAEFLVTSRDIPELNAIGDTFDQAMAEAVDALETAFMIYMDERKEIPSPSDLAEGEVWLFLPVRVSAKVALYNEMQSQHVTKADLAKRLKWGQKQVDRLWDLTHSTKLESIEQAFLSLGKRLDICFAG